MRIDDDILPVCPVCGAECETVFKDRAGVIFACDNCVDECDAYDEPECLPEDPDEYYTEDDMRRVHLV